MAPESGSTGPLTLSGVPASVGTIRRSGTTMLHFTLSADAPVALTFTRSVAGRLHSGHCVAPTASNRHRHACNRWVAAARVTAQGVAGANTLTLRRTEGGHALPTGHYRITVQAIGQTGGPSTTTLTVTGRA